MAQMHPEDIEDYEEATEGDKRVFKFIKDAARPHKDFICWYGPQIGSSGKGPEFVLFGKKVGLLIMEVKYWSSPQITSCNPHQFTLRVSEKAEKETNPDRQAKVYVNSLKEILSAYPELQSDHPKYRGKLKIPIGRMVVFPNISWFIAAINFTGIIQRSRGSCSLITTSPIAAGRKIPSLGR
jgi:hypothetical protein